MEIIDCFWEKENIGRKVVEISINSSDIFEANKIQSATQQYEYLVIKVPVHHTSFNFGLTKLGFTMIETQISLSKKFSTFNVNDKLISLLYDKVRFAVVNTPTDFERIQKRITPQMFITDRIALDPSFGPQTSCNRYLNWMRTEYEKGTSTFLKIFYNEEDVGFVMGRQNETVFRGLLGGIYPDSPRGLGILTASSPFLYAQKNNVCISKHITSISSNNTPMLEIYNYLNYKITKMSYVYIKHNK